MKYLSCMRVSCYLLNLACNYSAVSSLGCNKKLTVESGNGHLVEDTNVLQKCTQLCEKQNQPFLANSPSMQSRRRLFSKFCTLSAASSLGFVSPAVSIAAAPMSVGESDNLGARAERAFRTKPPKILRQRRNGPIST